jgi:hypothetical protein
VSNVRAIEPPAAGVASLVSERAVSRSKLFAPPASFLWGPSREFGWGLRASCRRPALSTRSAEAVGVRRTRAQPAPLFWGKDLGARMNGVPVLSRSGQFQIQPHTCGHRGGKLRFGAPSRLALASAASDNKSANTDPQLQEAASPQRLWSGCLQRYRA